MSGILAAGTLAAMLSAIVLAVAEEAEASKTAFYLAGGLLAVWAVVLGAAGLARAELPGNHAAERGIIGITGLLVVATLAAAILTS
jgi:hypothetical protein